MFPEIKVEEVKDMSVNDKNVGKIRMTGPPMIRPFAQVDTPPCLGTDCEGCVCCTCLCPNPPAL